METPTRSSDSISIPTDENDESYQEMSFSNKSTMPQTKHYMSPTISTASKANPPRRKILSERPNLDSPNMGGDKIGVGEEGFSESPYNPITNYLSPRPKFLRYKPNRMLEILSRVDNQVEADEETGSGGENDSVWSQGDDLKESIEEEFEEEEEESCGLKGLVKTFLCFVVLMLSTSYISSMNSPTPSPVVQAVVGCKDGYNMIQDHVYGFLKNLDGGKYFFVQTEVMKFLPSVDDGIEHDVELEISEDEENVEVNTSELETAVFDQVLEMSDVTEVVQDLITIPYSENTTSSAPAGTSETENEVVSELSKEEKVGRTMLTNDSVTSEEESSSKIEIIDFMTTGSFLINAIGGLLLSVLAALCFQKKRNGRHDISQAVERSFEQVPENNCSLVLENDVDAKLKYSESSDSCNTSLDSIERDFNNVYNARAPLIQLLGEFSVDEMSSSHRSYGMKNRNIESEVSSHSVSAENVNNRKTHSSPLHVRSIFSKISAMESPYEKNIVNSENGAEGESRKPVTSTPLRRSSRIRSRSIMSP